MKAREKLLGEANLGLEGPRSERFPPKHIVRGMRS
jgi:hypothetical protein